MFLELSLMYSNIFFTLLSCFRGILFAYIIETLFTQVPDCENDIDGVPCVDFYETVAADMREASWKISVACVGVIVLQAIGFVLLYYGFGTASERMNKRVRDAAFTSLIRQEVGFFDTHPSGILTTQLQDDAALIHSFSGEPIRTLVMTIASLLVGVVISFVFMWCVYQSIHVLCCILLYIHRVSHLILSVRKAFCITGSGYASFYGIWKHHGDEALYGRGRSSGGRRYHEKLLWRHCG